MHQGMRCSGTWAWDKGRGKREGGKARRELGFAELKRADFRKNKYPQLVG